MARIGVLLLLGALAVTAGAHITTAQEAPAEELPNTSETTSGGNGAEGASTPTPEAQSEAQSAPSTGDASVSTGDASAQAGAETTTNMNTTEVGAGATETTTTNDNTAEVDTAALTGAETGANDARAGGDATIVTGSAQASANIVNVINTNIFNAKGLLYFLNTLLGNVALDLRSLFSVLTDPAPVDSGCSLSGCTGGNATVTVSNQNTATVRNDVTVVANTGGNSAAAGDDASITTGDAQASANIVNVVNTNITDANYLLLSVNNFGAFGGDIVFPGAEWFRDLLQQSTAQGTHTSVTNENTASVSNTGTVVADTGDNSTSGDGAGITTGNSTADINVVNQVNTNVFGDSMLFLFRVHGAWTGNVFGLPEGMSWRQGAQGIELMLDPAGVSAPEGSTERLAVENQNTATVTNNVSVYALTGENKAEAGGDASITTGDAQASANIVNVVNTNILGRNWVLAIFNIFGDWGGNISFGQPDLWVGARAVVPGTLRSGACFDYEVTVNNLGDAPATNVELSGAYRGTEQSMPRFGTGGTAERIRVGRIEPRGTQTLTIPTCISGSVPGGSTVTTSFTATSRETDPNQANNIDTISVSTVAGGIPGGALRLGSSKLSVVKSSDRAVTSASSTVEYTVVIKNNGGPVYNALLVDTIYDTKRRAMHEQRWGLGTIAANEEITVSYTTTFNASTSAGVYRNEAFILGVDRNPDIESNLGNRVTSPIASTAVLVRALPVAGEVAPEVCYPLLTTYLRSDTDNDPEEVRELQEFLATAEGMSDLMVTGTYDPATEAAVHAFQRKYADDVLTPWGITTTTGYVYYTTQKKVNELWCNELFPLSPGQLAEIERFKTRVEEYVERDVPMPESEYREIGALPAREEDTRIAVADTAPSVSAEASAAPAPVAQVAAVSQALASEGTQNVWGSVKASVRSALSWFGW